MTNPTPHGQVPEALEDFEVRKLAAIGAVRTSSGLVERRPIEYRRELEDQFVRGFRAAEKRLSALSAAPAGWKLVPLEPSADQEWKGKEASLRVDSMAEACRIYKAMLAASPTPPAECITVDEFRPCPCCFGAGVEGTADDYGHTIDVACGECNGSGRDSKPTPPAEQQAPATEGYVQPVPDKCDRITWRGRYYHLPLTEQAAPKAAPAWEHHARKLTQWLHCMSHNDSYFGEPAGLVKQVTGELNRLIGAAPQQEAQQPVAWYEYNADLDAWFLAYRRNPKAKTRPLVFGDTTPKPAPRQEAQEPSRAAKTWCSYVAGMIGCYLNEPDESTKVQAIAGIIERRLWALPTPQPAPAPLSDDVVKDAARYRWLAAHCRSTAEHWGGRWSIIVDGPAPKSHDSEDDFDAAIDAALAAQGGKV